jgi:hypothetical protein
VLIAKGTPASPVCYREGGELGVPSSDGAGSETRIAEEQGVVQDERRLIDRGELSRIGELVVGEQGTLQLCHGGCYLVRRNAKSDDAFKDFAGMLEQDSV